MMLRNNSVNRICQNIKINRFHVLTSSIHTIWEIISSCLKSSPLGYFPGNKPLSFKHSIKFNSIPHLSCHSSRPRRLGGFLTRYAVEPKQWLQSLSDRFCVLVNMDFKIDKLSNNIHQLFAMHRTIRAVHNQTKRTLELVKIYKCQAPGI